MPKKLGAAVVILAVLAGLAAYKLYRGQETGITATGTIEITRSDITPKISGYLDELLLDEGNAVSKGQVVARIKRPDLEAQLIRDEAALRKAEAQLTDLRQGARDPERKAAAAGVAAARAVYEKTQNDYERYQELYRRGAIAAQQLDEARSAYDVARNNLTAQLENANLVAAGSRPDVIAAQQQEVERSRAVWELSRTALDDTVIVSPLAGLVLTKNFEPGEYVNAGTAIATVGDLSDCWVKIYVSSAQLGLIQPGQPAEVRVDSFPGQVFAGRIKEINQNAEFTPRQSITQQERANLVFAVKVRIDNPAGVLKPGMPADVVIK